MLLCDVIGPADTIRRHALCLVVHCNVVTDTRGASGTRNRVRWPLLLLPLLARCSLCVSGLRFGCNRCSWKYACEQHLQREGARQSLRRRRCTCTSSTHIRAVIHHLIRLTGTRGGGGGGVTSPALMRPLHYTGSNLSH